MYDVIIIGAGVNGTFIARELAKFELNILILEKNFDVGDATSAANSAIIHSGYDPHPNTLKAKLNIRGNELYTKIVEELDIEFKNIGSLTIATNDLEYNELENLVARAKTNNVKVEVLSADEVLKLEPLINPNVKGAILAPSASIINPFELCVGLAENAVDNGAELKFEEEVVNIIRTVEGFKVITKTNEYSSKVVVNAAGVYSDKLNNLVNEKKYKIIPRKGEYYVLDHFEKPFVNHVIFSIPTKDSKGVLITPTTSSNYLVGPSSTPIESREDFSTNKDILGFVLNKAKDLVRAIPMDKNIRQFAGLRASEVNGDFVLENNNGFINVLGFDSPGLAAAPATAEVVVRLVGENLELRKKKEFKPRRRVIRLREKTKEEIDELIKKDKSFGNIICRCEKISEGEIVDGIRRSVGARSLKGVKKRSRPGAGKCQGGFCEALVLRILARELDIDINEVKLDTVGSEVLKEKIKAGSRYEE